MGIVYDLLQLAVRLPGSSTDHVLHSLDAYVIKMWSYHTLKVVLHTGPIIAYILRHHWAIVKPPSILSLVMFVFYSSSHESWYIYIYIHMRTRGPGAVSRAGTSNYIPEYLSDGITYTCLNISFWQVLWRNWLFVFCLMVETRDTAYNKATQTSV